MSEFVKGQCPLCGSGVFVGSCGWLTCSGSECPDPLFVGEIFEKYKESNSNLGELMRIVKQLEAMTVPAPRLECVCPRFRDTGGYRIADLTCPIHGVNGTEPGDGYWEDSE